MARNSVQFQKGLSEAQFAVLYGTEDRCRDVVFGWRWPSGFVQDLGSVSVVDRTLTIDEAKGSL
jgi:hypothetical protein